MAPARLMPQQSALAILICSLWMSPLTAEYLLNTVSGVDVEDPAPTDAPFDAENTSQEVGNSSEKKKTRIRTICAPELGPILEKKETFKTYAQNAQKFCNASSSWAESHLHVREVIGFVGPWSDHGYRASRYMRGKLTHTSPLWFRVLPGRSDSDAFEIAGWDIASEQDIWQEQAGDEYCHDGICTDGPDILPHFSIEGFDNMSALRVVLENPRNLAAEIAVTVDRGKFQGIVLDIRLALFKAFKPLVPSLVKEISRALHAGGRRFVLSVPAVNPSGRGPDFDANDAADVAAHVDAVVVGTRDFSRLAPGPAAPLAWVRASVLRLMADSTNGNSNRLRPEQLLLEIPMYGRAFQEGESSTEGKVILTGEIVKAFARQRPKLKWDAEAAEHSANLTKSNVYISFPTLAFVRARLQLARSLGVGVALRELSAGLDSAFDLLPMRSAKSIPHNTEASESSSVEEATASDKRSAASSEL